MLKNQIVLLNTDIDAIDGQNDEIRKMYEDLESEANNFRQPAEEVIKENVKMYFNTMKPFPSEYGDDDDNSTDVDYTKNDRWRWIEEMKKSRMKRKLQINKSGVGDYANKNLILSYYNINDPYIQIFNNLNVEELILKSILFPVSVINANFPSAVSLS